MTPTEILRRASETVAVHGLPADPHRLEGTGWKGAVCDAAGGVVEHPGGNRWSHPEGYEAAYDALAHWLRWEAYHGAPPANYMMHDHEPADRAALWLRLAAEHVAHQPT